MKEFYKHLATQAEQCEAFIPAAAKTPTCSGAAGSEGSGISGTTTTVNNPTRGGPSGKVSKQSCPDRIGATSLAATCGGPDKQKKKTSLSKRIGVQGASFAEGLSYHI
jgi:hypothetical protein